MDPALLLIGGGLLYLLMGKKGQTRSPQTPQGTQGGGTQPYNPGTQDNTVRDVSTGLSLTGTGIGIIGGGTTLVAKLVSAASGGTVAVAGSGAAAPAPAAGGGSAAVAVNAALVTTGAGWGGVVLLAAIIAVIIITQVVNSVQIFQNSLMNFFRSEPTTRARTWFKWFVGAALTAGKPPTLGYVPAYGPYRLALPSDVIRRAALTALYLEYVGYKSHYDGLAGFWSRSTGYVPEQGAPVPIGGSVMPGEPWSVIVPPPVYTTEQIKFVLNGPGAFQCAPDANPPCDYNSIVAPAGFDEAQSAAFTLLGDKRAVALAYQEFAGKALAIAFATTQLFKEFMPSPYDFCVAVRDTVVPGWSVQEATYWTTSKQPLTAYWLIDPGTGNRIAPAKIRETMSMVVSIKGMEVSQGVFAGVSRFGRFAAGGMRRFALASRGRYG